MLQRQCPLEGPDNISMKPTNRQGGGARGREEPTGHSGRQGKRRVPVICDL